LSPLSQSRAASVYSIQVGRVAPLGPEGVPSGFVKRAVSGPLRVRTLGLEGDEQADLTVHGGPDKAVYLYPAEHYPRWFSDVPHHRHSLVAGGFGENLTVAGLDEDSVSIGDTFRVGTATMQVTQPRQPCFKLGLRFDDKTLGRIMMQTGRSGWYVRVLKEGDVSAGDALVTVDRPNPAWTVARFNRFILSTRDDRADLSELAALEGLAGGWKQRAAQWLGEERRP
jgi:MOSC domain-containing protein YiiM